MFAITIYLVVVIVVGECDCGVVGVGIRLLPFALSTVSPYFLQ